MLMEDSPILVKEITTKENSIKIEQHGNLYVVVYNGKNLPPVSTLSMALYFFDKLIDKQDKTYNN